MVTLDNTSGPLLLQLGSCTVEDARAPVFTQRTFTVLLFLLSWDGTTSVILQ